MTVTEQERVSAPDIERRDAREERARILEAAALEIEVRGWNQHDYCTTGGAVCALGALCVVVFGHANGQDLSAEEWELVDGAFGACHPSADFLWEWNDEDGRTADEVTFLLRWRAQEIRDGR